MEGILSLINNTSRASLRKVGKFFEQVLSLVCVGFLLFTYTTAQAQNEFDIQIVLDEVDCTNNTACYTVMLRSSDGVPFNLAGQNYRLFYDASVGSFISGTSLLPTSNYNDIVIAQDLQNVDASSVGALSFDNNLGFLNYSIDITDDNIGGISLPIDGSWLPTSQLCFLLTPSALNDPTMCFEAIWARDNVTDGYFDAFVDVNRWIQAGQIGTTTGRSYIDLTDENNSSCLINTCTDNCIVTYEIVKTGDVFQVNMISNTVFDPNASPPENYVSTMQVTMRVKTGGFQVSNFTNLLNTPANYWSTSLYASPIENIAYDYLSFGLNPVLPLQLPFQQGNRIPLFSFENGGACTEDILQLIDIFDPAYPPNQSGINVGQQITISGYQSPDAPICIDRTSVPDCTETCKVDYKIEKRSDGRFQVSMIPRVTYTGAFENYISTMQVTVKVHAGSFQVANLIDLLPQVGGGIGNMNDWALTATYPSPGDNPAYDYFSFALTDTDKYPFIANQEVPLFTFENSGDCTSSLVTLISEADPFYPPNSDNSNSGQQLTVAGYGQPDIPICVYGSGAQDCSTNCFFSCNDDVQVSLGINCTAEILPDMLATALDLTCPGGTKTVEVRGANNSLIPTSPFVDISHLNQTLNVSVVDDFSGNSCWGTIIIKDKTGPNIRCEDIIVDCSIDIAPTNPLIGYPEARDNCLDIVTNLSFEDEINSSLCIGNYTAVVNRTWSANDGNEHGHVSSCVQRIYLNRLRLEDVRFPIDKDGLDAPVLPCIGENIEPEYTGVPSLDGHAIFPSFNGLCEINVGYQDQIATTCGGSKQILRTWTAVSTCDGAFRTHVQVIKLEDNEAPTINCISDTLQQNTNLHDCTATINLPSMNVSDACSGVTVHMQTPYGVINSNGGILEGAEQGYHDIVYVATDACGNTAECTVVIQIVDVDGPTAVCNNSQVAIGPSGWVDVNASTADDGSFDECCAAVSFLIIRTDQEADFSELISFSCEDIGKTIDVILQVTDCFDNKSQCTATILVINDNSSNIQCPPNATIACTDDYSDLNLFGAPILLDNCGSPSFDVQNEEDLDACGTGTIARYFSILDGGVVTGTCTQFLTIENESTFNPSSIVWPHNYLTLACGGESLLPANLPATFNEPTYEVIGTCNNIFARYTDSNFDDSVDAAGCYEIHRLWEVIDWCIYDIENPTAGGIYSYTQIISIVNNVPPTFSCSDITAAMVDENCTSYVNLLGTALDDCTPSNLMTYTYSIDQYTDGTIDVTGESSDASGVFPTGTHQISFTATDDCGNQSDCFFSFTIVDDIAPIAKCFFPDVIIVPKSGDLAAVPDAAIIGQASTDNCSNFEDLTFRVSPTFFTCEEVGSNQITLTVIDQSNNSASCNGEIRVVDANNLCPVPRTAINISGNITDEIGQMMEQVSVRLDHSGVAPSMTNQAGNFQLDSVPVGLDYTILPERNFDPLNGVSTFDLVVLNRHILGLQYINSPYKLIAADVNRSGTITTYDLVSLRRIILRLTDKFPNNTSWRFIMRDFVFDDPSNPLAEYFPEVYSIQKAPGNDMNMGGFIAIKVGDVNNSASTTSFVEGESRSATDLWTLLVEDKTFTKGSIVEIPIKAKNWRQILGFQFALQVDPALEILDIQTGDIPKINQENIGLHYKDKGIITASWEQVVATKNTLITPTIYTLKVKVNQTISTTEAISIHKDFMKAEAYQEQVNDLPTLMDLQLEVSTTATSTVQTKLYQNRPNPFGKNTVIGFDLVEAQTASLKIMDLSGRIIKHYQDYFQQGYNEVLLQKESLPNEGLYYYQLETKNTIETKKMLVVN